MKQVLLMLAIAGATYTSANAQSGSAYDVNYNVCRTNGKYHVCSNNSPQIIDGKEKANDNEKQVEKSLSRLNSYTYVKGTPRQQGESYKKNPRFIVTYNDPQAPYEGKESLVNDGVEKNKNRNINYLDNSVDLPPVDGGIAVK